MRNIRKMSSPKLRVRIGTHVRLACLRELLVIVADKISGQKQKVEREKEASSNKPFQSKR